MKIASQVALPCLLVLGCSLASSNAEPRPGIERDDSAHVPAPSPDAAASCPALETIALVGQRYQGATYALYAPVEVDGKKGLLHVDTASPITGIFADVPSVVERYARGRIGCRGLDLAGLGGLGRMPDVEGLPVVGIAGADLLLAEPSVLDVEKGEWVRNPTSLARIEPGVDVPFSGQSNVLTVDVTFDGRPVKAILDTGSGHTLSVDSAPRPGEQKYTSEDALGRPLVVYVSTLTLGLGSRSGTVALSRVPDFDIVKWWADALGTPLAGLVGLSSIRALYVDAGSHTLRIVPVF